jgi:ubiquinone/menaquinone biosynthesis C-methylase UbiE
MNGLLTTIARRLKRMRRRRKVGRAYDMALEITRILRVGDKVIDVGCGNGFIAHHLSSLLGKRVVGLDVSESTSAHIDYLPYDGEHFPLLDRTFDAVLLCYVLHHAQDAGGVLAEAHRVLKQHGSLIVYEDSPSCWWDRVVCWVHNQQWKSRTGPCNFQLKHEWDRVFRDAGFKVLNQRSLSRWRNVAHPVSRNFFVLEAELRGTNMVTSSRLENWPETETRAA